MRITKEEILKAQKEWGDGIVKIGKAFTEEENYEQVAKDHIDSLYAYKEGTVLFKPTKAADQQFRPSEEKALSYFTASNQACPEDKGFAIQPWTAVRFENSNFILNENSALAMGNYFFTDTDGSEVKVEYSFAYIKDASGKIRINLHHSSIPFSG